MKIQIEFNFHISHFTLLHRHYTFWLFPLQGSWTPILFNFRISLHRSLSIGSKRVTLQSSLSCRTATATTLNYHVCYMSNSNFIWVHMLVPSQSVVSDLILVMHNFSNREAELIRCFNFTLHYITSTLWLCDHCVEVCSCKCSSDKMKDCWFIFLNCFFVLLYSIF